MSKRVSRALFTVLGLTVSVWCTCVFAPIAQAATIVAAARPGELSPHSAEQDVNVKAQEFVDRGKKAYQAGDYKFAIANYSEALKLKAGDARLFYNRGLAFMKLEDPEQAIKDFSECLAIAPEFYMAWMNRANMNVRRNRLPESLPDYDKAIQLKPDDYLIWYNRGVVHSRLGQTENALRDLNEALKLNPYDGQSYSARADLYLSQGDRQAAAADYRRVLVITPGAKHAAERLARIDTISTPSSTNDIVKQEAHDGDSVNLIELAVNACFAMGDTEEDLQTMAVTSGWSPVGSEELKKQSSAANSMTGGWTFEGAAGPIAVIQSRENVTPPVRICSLIMKLPSHVRADDLQTALQSALKMEPADRFEHADQITSGYWVPHTPECTARVSMIFSTAQRLLTIRMMHGRKSSVGGSLPAYPGSDNPTKNDE